MKTLDEVPVISAVALADMRVWLADHVASDLDLPDAQQMAAVDVPPAIDWHYAGGVRQFLQDRQI